MTHLTAELLKMQAGIDMTHVVYRGGTPAMNDLLAGHLPMQFATVLQALAQYKAGQLRALGVVVGGALRVDAGSADVPGAGLRFVAIGMVRAARAGRHAETDHRQAQRRDEAHDGAAGHGRAARRSS